MTEPVGSNILILIIINSIILCSCSILFSLAILICSIDPFCPEDGPITSFTLEKDNDHVFVEGEDINGGQSNPEKMKLKETWEVGVKCKRY